MLGKEEMADWNETSDRPRPCSSRWRWHDKIVLSQEIPEVVRLIVISRAAEEVFLPDESLLRRVRSVDVSISGHRLISEFRGF